MLLHIGIDPKEQESIHNAFNAALSNESVDFSDRLNNLWNAQTETVEKYGRDGLMLLLDYQTQVYVDTGINRSMEIMHYSEVPETCPWHGLHLLPLDEAIRKAWKAYPIEFSVSLETYCKDLFAIFEDEKWFLAYAYETKNYDDVKYYEFLGGCQPEPDAKLPEALIQAGWKMPKDLKALYAVHSNFGHIMSSLRNEDTACIPGADKLEASLTFLEEYVAEWEVDYSFFDLLPFCQDGAGNSQNFYKTMPVEGSYMTVDWDHETKEVSGAQRLEDFIEYEFGKKLKEIENTF